MPDISALKDYPGITKLYEECHRTGVWDHSGFYTEMRSEKEAPYGILTGQVIRQSPLVLYKVVNKRDSDPTHTGKRDWRFILYVTGETWFQMLIEVLPRTTPEEMERIDLTCASYARKLEALPSKLQAGADI